MMSQSRLPSPYAEWVSGLIHGSMPHEREARCDKCPMCCEGATPEEGDLFFFSAEAKCCTCIPELPNFRAGAVLADDDPRMAEGRRGVIARIAGGEGQRECGFVARGAKRPTGKARGPRQRGGVVGAYVDAPAGRSNEACRDAARTAVETEFSLTLGDAVTPAGIGPPGSYVRPIDHQVTGFGRRRAPRCPHLLPQGGTCGIWPHRTAMCSTWFCMHSRGALGFSFWRAVYNLLQCVERDLSIHCALEVGLGPDATGALLSAPRGAGPDRERAWGRWQGLEAEFYMSCHQVARSMSWKDVSAACGPEVRVRAQQLVEASRRLNRHDLPDRLVPGERRTEPAGSGLVLVWTYSPHDPLMLAEGIEAVLDRFDGRPVSRVLADVRGRFGVTLDRDLLDTLVDFEVLVEP